MTKLELGSPPAWWCGLKYNPIYLIHVHEAVTTCVVVWIEIISVITTASRATVTTCVVVWIEIFKSNCIGLLAHVTTCVVVWIEIL